MEWNGKHDLIPRVVGTNFLAEFLVSCYEWSLSQENMAKYLKVFYGGFCFLFGLTSFGQDWPFRAY